MNNIKWIHGGLESLERLGKPPYPSTAFFPQMDFIKPSLKGAPDVE